MGYSNQTLQICIRLKVITKQDMIDKKINTLPLPLYFELDHLKPLSIDQIVWFDETHIEQSGLSSCHPTKRQIRFKRDANGKYDPNGNYGQERTKTAFKYAKQEKFCLGVAAVRYADASQLTGVRCKSISYTNKKIIPEKESQKRKMDEIERVKSLRNQPKNSPWINSERLNDKCLWDDDDVVLLPNVGKAKKKKFTEMGISTIGELKSYAMENDIEMKGIKRMLLMCKNALPGKSPRRLIDQSRTENPYLSRFGDGSEDAISAATALSPFISIHTIVMQIIERADEVMINTNHPDDWVFYHYALSLMTSKECIKWMKSTIFKGILIFNRWLLPEKGLNKGTRYEETVVGNYPEFMPLDNSLNRDIRATHDMHCMYTNHLHKEDHRRFSKATPNLIDRGIRRIWDDEEGCPSSKQIL